MNRNVTWSSSDESVATVDENGLVTYIKPGYCTIVCKTEDGAFIATCNFIISIPVETIKLDYKDEIMSIGTDIKNHSRSSPDNGYEQDCKLGII